MISMNNLIALLPTSRLYERLNSEKKGAQEIFYKQFFFSVLFRCDHIQIIDAYQRRLSEVNMVQCALHSKCTSSLALSIVSHKHTHTHNRSFYTTQLFILCVKPFSITSSSAICHNSN